MIDSAWSLAWFVAMNSGHALIAYKHTSFWGLLLLHVIQTSTTWLSKYSPRFREYWKTKILCRVKRAQCVSGLGKNIIFSSKRQYIRSSNQHLILWMQLQVPCWDSIPKADDKHTTGGSWSYSESKKGSYERFFNKKSTIKKQFYVTYHKKYIEVSVPEEHGPTLLYLQATFTFSVYKAQ